MARSRTSALSVAVALGCTAVAYNLSAAFVGSSPQLRGGPAVARGVGTDYLVRNGPKDADPPAVDTSKAAGATVDIEFKKRPFGIARYVPGVGGKGAVVRDVTQKTRYPGDPQGQAFVAGVQARLGAEVRERAGRVRHGFLRHHADAGRRGDGPSGCHVSEPEGVRGQDRLEE
ncbi:unnamed protein product [Polarella glacialis]|uniref:Uncharacterized protein n=1 Tax=Polarella glacialis TaxID=89957 RepID=A0A813LQK6_POLGL|nr:unnamed protein product [Polarella glacialis]